MSPAPAMTSTRTQQAIKAFNSACEAYERGGYYRRPFKPVCGSRRGGDLNAFFDLPFMTKDGLRAEQQQNLPWGRISLCEPEEIIQIQQSSGTTGRPVTIPVTASDLRAWIHAVGRCMRTAGFRSGDVVLQAFGMSRCFGGGLPLVQVAQGNGMCVVPMGAEAGAERLLMAVRDLSPTCLMGTPHFLEYVAERAPDILPRPLADYDVRAMLVGGEPGGEALMPRLRSAWGSAVSEGLGASEIQPGMWQSCAEGDGMHFQATATVFFELVDPDGASLPIEAGARGELVYSDLTRRGMRLIRYRIGDVAEVVGGLCRCGRRTPRIRIVGRTDDMLLVRGVNVYPAAVQQAVASLHPAVTGRVEILWNEPGYSSQRPLRVRVEVPEADRMDESLRRTAAAVIRNRCGCRAQIELVAVGTLPPTEADTKVQLVRRGAA